MFRYSKKNALKFEKHLNSSHSLPIGSFIGQKIQLIYKYESAWRRSRAALQLLAASMKPNPKFETKRFSFIDRKKTYIILTLIKNDHRYKKFILPVCEELAKLRQNIILICPEDFAKPEINCPSENIILIPFNYFNGIPGKLSYEKLNTTQILRTCLSHGFSLLTSVRFMLLIKDQFYKVNNFFSFLKSIHVRCVLTEYDRNSRVVPLITGANTAGISTFTLVHGSLTPPDSYYPFVAKKILTWGIRQTETFCSLGYPRSIFENVGNNRLEKVRSDEKSKALIIKRLKIKSQMKIVTLITNTIYLPDRIQLARNFIDAVSSLPEWVGVIKLHPVEKKSDYHDALTGIADEKIKIYDSKEVDSQSLLVITDVFVNHNSIMGLEILAQQKPVIVFDCIKSNLGIGEEMVRLGGCLHAKSSHELRALIPVAEKNYYKKIGQTQCYVAEHFYNLGYEATNNIVNEVLNENT